MNSDNNKKRRALRSCISRRLVGQYFAALILYKVLYIVFVLIGIGIATSISWRTTPLYYIGQFEGDYARVGIALYGVLSTIEDEKKWEDKLSPVLSLKARVASVRELARGECAGYGMAFTAEKTMRIATLAIGYADGLPRELSLGKGYVLIDGKRAPVIGRICMDQTIVDVSDIDGVKSGNAAVIIGISGGECIRASQIAKEAGTITNEIVSRMGSRLNRIIT